VRPPPNARHTSCKKATTVDVALIPLHTFVRKPFMYEAHASFDKGIENDGEEDSLVAVS